LGPDVHNSFPDIIPVLLEPFKKFMTSKSRHAPKVFRAKVEHRPNLSNQHRQIVLEKFVLLEQTTDGTLNIAAEREGVSNFLFAPITASL
jgi:hypothetical protein